MTCWLAFLIALIVSVQRFMKKRTIGRRKSLDGGMDGAQLLLTALSEEAEGSEATSTIPSSIAPTKSIQSNVKDVMKV